MAEWGRSRRVSERRREAIKMALEGIGERKEEKR